jgi:hypothetical protein
MTKKELIDKLKPITPECEIMVYNSFYKVSIPISFIFYEIENGEGRIVIQT